MMPSLMLFVRGAIVLAFALVAVRLLRGSSAAMRHAVLGAALTAVLVLPVIEVVVPTWHTGAIEAAVAPAIAPELPIAEVGGAPVAATPIAVRPADVEVPWRSILIGAWFAIAALAVLRVGIGAYGARAIARRGTPANAESHVAGAWRALDGKGQPPRAVVSDEIESPIVVGAIAPVVVVPRSSSAWDGERWRVVLLHELAHVRQRDGVVNLIAQLACCLHWINPLAWIAARRLREERELAADDAVLRAGARASTYAEHLLAIATTLPRHAPVSVLAMASRPSFEARVVALLDADRPRRTVRVRRAMLVAVVAVAVAAACVSPESSPVESPAPSNSPSPPPTADAELQRFVESELAKAVAEHSASGAVAIVLDAKTGAPLALASRGDLDPRAGRTPGSTIKPFTVAAALEAGTIDVNTKVDCENGARRYGTRTLRDAVPNQVLDLGRVLAVSSNVCTAKIAEPLGDLLGQSLRRYRISAPANIDTHTIEGASIASGEGLLVSPLELASAYTALAGDGVFHAPSGDGVRVMREDTARAVRQLLERVVVDPAGTGHAARVDGMRVGGKTGTTRSRPGKENHYASFVGVAPVEEPRVVILVGLDGVTGSGGKVAAPVFSAIAARATR